MNRNDARLVAALTVLRDRLAPVVDEISFGELDADDRTALARALRTVADDLDRVVEVVEPRERLGPTPQRQPDRRGLARRTFSNSGPGP